MTWKNKIFNEDCITGLKNVPNDSVDSCVTDPPYNYEFIGKSWDTEEIKRRMERVQNSKTLVKNIPYGSGLSGGVRNVGWYKKNRDNVLEYQKWCVKWANEVYRVLKNGSFCMVFNSTRTIAHVQVALEEAGFYTKDMIVWKRHSGIPKGLNFAKKLEKMNMEDYEKWVGWHSCLRSEWEAIIVVQKPLINNHIETIKKTGLGLLYAEKENYFQSNIIEFIKRDKKEDFNVHCTVKPLDLITKLIEMTTPKEKNRIVLDPFMGSGTTALAALKFGVSYLGFEISSEYCDIIQNRLENVNYENDDLFYNISNNIELVS